MGLVDHERRQPLLAGARIGHREEHQAAGMRRVADELLGAVDDIPVALLHRPGLQVGRIRPGLRFGQPERADMLPGRQLAQPAVLLRVVAVVVDHDAGRRVVHRHHGRDRPVAGGDLLQQQGVGHRVDLAAVPLRRGRRAEHPQLAQFGDDLRLDPLLLLALRRQRRQPLLREAADHVDDQGVAIGGNGGRGDAVGHGDCLRLRTLPPSTPACRLCQRAVRRVRRLALSWRRHPGTPINDRHRAIRGHVLCRRAMRRLKPDPVPEALISKVSGSRHPGAIRRQRAELDFSRCPR